LPVPCRRGCVACSVGALFLTWSVDCVKAISTAWRNVASLKDVNTRSSKLTWPTLEVINEIPPFVLKEDMSDNEFRQR